MLFATKLWRFRSFVMRIYSMLYKTISKFSVGKETIWHINDLFWKDFMHSYVWLQNILEKISLKIIARHISRQTSGSKIQRNQTVPQAGIRKCSQKWDSQVNGWTDLSNQTVNRNLSSAQLWLQIIVLWVTRWKLQTLDLIFFLLFSINLSEGCNKRMASSDRAEKSTSNTASGSLSRIASFILFFFLVLASGKISYRFQNEKKFFFLFFDNLDTQTDWMIMDVWFFAFSVCSVWRFFLFCQKINFVKGLAQTMEPPPHTHLYLKFAYVKLVNTISYDWNLVFLRLEFIL